MIRHDKEARNEGETMALACGIYESSNTKYINICAFMTPMAHNCAEHAKVLLNIFFVSLLNVNLESVLACWPVIACIVVNIGYVVLVTVLGFG